MRENSQILSLFQNYLLLCVSVLSEKFLIYSLLSLLFLFYGIFFSSMKVCILSGSVTYDTRRKLYNYCLALNIWAQNITNFFSALYYCTLNILVQNCKNIKSIRFFWVFRTWRSRWKLPTIFSIKKIDQNSHHQPKVFHKRTQITHQQIIFNYPSKI